MEDNAMASLENVASVKIKIRKKKTPSDIVFDVIVYAVLILFAAVVLYPVINMLAYSFSDGKDAVYGRIHLLPHVWSTKSYESVLFERESIRNGAVTTIARTLIGTAIGVAANAFLAFILSRKKFIFKKVLSLFWIITIYAQAGIIPTLCLYRKLHLDNSFWVYIIPGIISGIYVLVMRTYMKGIPDSLEEAAKLDGAGYVRSRLKEGEGYSPESAASFSEMMKRKLGTNVYGDPEYVPHVLRYYKKKNKKTKEKKSKHGSE